MYYNVYTSQKLWSLSKIQRKNAFEFNLMEMFGVKQQKVDFIKNENIGIFIKVHFFKTH